MTLSLKNYLIAGTVILVALVVTLVTWFAFAHKTFGASPQGSEYFNGNFAGAVISLANPGANATSTSILNTTGNDLYVTGEKVACENVGTAKTAYTGAGLASQTVTIATSSTAAPASNGNTNTLPVVTIATSTTQFDLSSSTAGTPGNGLVSNIWAAGAYMTFTVNATSTATCTVGVDYIGS